MEELIIEGLENFPSPDENTMPALKYLRIVNYSQLKDISHGLKRLKSLEQLELDKTLEENSRQILNAAKIKVRIVGTEEKSNIRATSGEAGRESLKKQIPKSRASSNDPVLDYFEESIFETPDQLGLDSTEVFEEAMS